ncbi:MAG: type II secretion system inner membrane protein GspF [Deltaproteobacteria bacterium]|nr:type II secretion system inner membrane protein GspF [Deltaproteobacteria bacterium]
MPIYSYKGIDSTGKKVSGTLDAESIKAARARLRKINVFPTEVGEGKAAKSGTKGFQFFQKVKVQEIAEMTRQLSTLIGANIPLVDSLNALVDQIENPKLKQALSDIRDKVVEGSRLADAMKAYPYIFSDLYLNMITAGEASGALDTVLSRLADFTESQAKLRSKVNGALTYPVVMGAVGGLLMCFLLVGVVPKITKIFIDAKMKLPLPTQIVVSLSGFISSYWFVFLLAIPLLLYAFNRFKNSTKGRFMLDRFSLRAPIFGDMLRKLAISRFCRTLSTMMLSGVQLLAALDIVKNVVGNVVLSQVIEETRTSVKEGESIAEPLRRSGQFPPIVTQMIAIGEKTGELENMLEKVANNYEQQVDTKVSTLTTLLEPIMIVVMGVVVAFIVLSILFPMLKMGQVVKHG